MSMPAVPPPARPGKPLTELVVASTEQLSPSMIRINFTATDLASFAHSTDTDRYVKMEFGQADGTTILRTYSVPIVDVEAGTLAIDFVIHPGPDGEPVGIAAPWAATAAAGDRITVRGPGSGYAPDPTADWHLIAGDESALPAMRAAVAALSDTARGHWIIDAAPANRQSVTAPDGVSVTWADGNLPQAVKAVEWLDGRVQCFVHGEAQVVMHEIRPWLLTEKGLPRADVSISGYWREGRTEETFREWKRDLAAAEAGS